MKVKVNFFLICFVTYKKVWSSRKKVVNSQHEVEIPCLQADLACVSKGKTGRKTAAEVKHVIKLKRFIFRNEYEQLLCDNGWRSGESFLAI